MIKLVLGGDHPHQATLGPAPAFRIGGHFIRQAPDMRAVATYRDRSWKAQGERFIRCDCFDKAEVCFEDVAWERSECFGPFEHIWTIDGVLYIAVGRPFAILEGHSRLWHCLSTDTYWPVLVILEAKETP